jgi:hypothetical protein
MILAGACVPAMWSERFIGKLEAQPAHDPKFLVNRALRMKIGRTADENEGSPPKAGLSTQL